MSGWKARRTNSRKVGMNRRTSKAVPAFSSPLVVGPSCQPGDFLSAFLPKFVGGGRELHGELHVLHVKLHVGRAQFLCCGFLRTQRDPLPLPSTSAKPWSRRTLRLSWRVRRGMGDFKLARMFFREAVPACARTFSSSRCNSFSSGTVPANGARRIGRNRTTTSPPQDSISGATSPAASVNSAILIVPRPQDSIMPRR